MGGWTAGISSKFDGVLDAGLDFTFGNDIDTKISRSGADQLSLTSGGVEALRLTRTLREIEANTTIAQTDGGDLQFKTVALHDLVINDVTRFSAGTGTLPTGISENTNYYVTEVDSTTLFNVSLTKGGANITFTDAGTAFTSNELPITVDIYGNLDLSGIATNQLFLSATSDPANPALQFSAGVGIYSVSNTIRFAFGSVFKFEFNSGFLQVGTTTQQLISTAPASLTSPGYTFGSDIGSGLVHVPGASGIVGIAANSITGTVWAESSGGVVRRNQVNSGLTAFATGGQGNLQLTSGMNQFSTVGTTGDSADAPAAIAGFSIEFTVINNGANDMNLFPKSGDNLGAGVDTAISVAAGTNHTYISYDATNYIRKT